MNWKILSDWRVDNDLTIWDQEDEIQNDLRLSWGIFWMETKLDHHKKGKNT